MTALFYTSGAVALVSAILVITGKNMMRAVLSLLVFLLAAASIFYTLGGPLVAALQIVVYAGAILVLFVFAVMMLGQAKEKNVVQRGWADLALWILPVILAEVLFIAFAVAVNAGPVRQDGVAMPTSSLIQELTPSAPPPTSVSPKEVGMSLFGEYAVAVELASILLLAALVAAYHYARKQEPEVEDE